MIKHHQLHLCCNIFIETSARLFREPANAERNRQADHDAVDSEAQNEVVKFERASGMKRGQRQNNKSHYLIYRGAIEQSAHQRVFYQEPQLAAGRVVNRRDREGDKEVQENSENVRTGATISPAAITSG